MTVVLASTFTALSVTGIAMVVYELRTYENALVNDLRTQADLLARATSSALVFNDRQVGQENLSMLRLRPLIASAAIYDQEEGLFARYERQDAGRPSGDDVITPQYPELDGHRIEGHSLVLFHPVIENGQRIGTVFLRADYELLARLKDYLGILAVVLVASMAAALLLATRLQSAITGPIHAVTDVAREVMEKRNFSPRVKKESDDELGYLVDAFNDMLTEVGKRTEALEQSNRALQREMAERMGAVEALRTADRRKDEFLATLAHELRNPLAPMRNALQILRMADGDPVVLAQASDIMERQLRQMVRLVDDLLDVSRITTGKLVLQKARVSLQEVARNALETVRPFIELRGHPLDVALPPVDVALYADGARLSQVFANLLHNAAKYSDPGGPISFTAVMEGDDLVVEVVDRGIGIVPQMLPEMFGMFMQADQSLERSHAGLGVGLALSKTLVEMHGGRIDAFSAGPGEGSRFTVRLPVASRVTGDMSDAGGTGVALTRALRIVLADDNVDFARSMATLLRAQGHDVRLAHDGESAWAVISADVPDIAFLDIGMPRLNGYDLARRIRALPAQVPVKLVAVTGWGQLKDREQAMAAGFDLHLVKPVDFERVQRILADLDRNIADSTA